MANQRLILELDGERFTIAKRMGGPGWYPSPSDGLARFCEELSAWLINEGGCGTNPKPIIIRYEHERVDWLDPPLEAEDPVHI